MDQKPVKVRLAEKYSRSIPEQPLVHGTETAYESSDLEAAYLAGFDRAKAMCVDAVQRFADEWVPDDGSGKKLSEHVATIGELP